MNQIPFTKNGLPLLIYTQFIILFVVCMPLCSTGIIKREIQPSNTTKLIWQPMKIANITSANVTTTTITPTEKTSSTTPRISRRTSTTTTTATERLTTHATTEKNAEIISKDNVTVASSVIDSQSDKNNLDDDAEVITDGDVDGVTTEEHRFDLSRYTSDYNGNDNEQSDYNETHQQLINENETDRDENQSTYNIDYEHNLRDMVLTTPESSYFDEKHKEYENDKSFERYQDDNAVPIKESESQDKQSQDKQYNSDTLLNGIHSNSSEERKQSTYLNKAEVESSNYDISATETKESTVNNGTATGEKKAKFMQEGSHVNLTIPNNAEVWALASMKNVEHTKNSQGQFYNVTTLEKDADKNGTLVTKQLADWVEVTKNNDFSNSTYATKNEQPVTTEIEQPVTTSNAPAEGSTQINKVLEALRHMNFTFNTTPRRRWNLTTTTPRPKVNTTNQLVDWSEIFKNLSTNRGRFASNNTNTNTSTNTSNRGRLKFQPQPLVISDQDSASQENQIISVQMTTLPPPIAVTRNYSPSTRPPILPKTSDSENKIHIQQSNDSAVSVTDIVTEKEDVDTSTTQTETAQNADDSQNELKTKFVYSMMPGTTEMESDTTTEKMLDATKEIEPSTSSFDFDEISTVSPIDETKTQLTTIQPEDENVRTTTEREYPTTNHINLETDAVTEVDEDDEDHTMHDRTSITAAPITTEEETLQSQSSTLQPRYVEKTTEMKNPTTEFTRTTTNADQPRTESMTTKDSKLIDRLPDSDKKEELTTNVINLNRDEYKYSTIKTDEKASDATTHELHTPDAIPEVIEDNTQPQAPSTDNSIPDIGGYSLDEPDTNKIIAITISVVGVVAVGIVVGVLLIMRKRKKQLTYGQRCRPVGLDAYSLDNVSVYNSVRRKGVLRMSKRSYGNAAFDDPGLKNNLLSASALAAFAQKKNEIYEEFKELPTVTARAEEVPFGCEDKNRYANIIPLPESRVFLKRIGDDEKTEYINANYVKGPKDHSHYYIACQAPLDSTVIDFWRMIWEQNSRVIIMATDLIENGIEQCSEYLPPSFVIDNHVTFGDFHITLKHRDVKETYAMSMVHLKNMNTNTWREITHFWYTWPDTGVPKEQSSLIELLLEARGYLKVTTAEQIDDNENNQNNNGNVNVGNGGVDKSKSLLRTQAPLIVHCSPGTGRTGTIIACDIALRALEQPTKSVDIPQIVYFVRRGRASAVRTSEQYEFIYKVANVYAAKLTGSTTEN